MFIFDLKINGKMFGGIGNKDYICSKILKNMQTATVFNNAQIEMLNAMACLKTDEDLIELKEAISKFFAMRAQRELDKMWDEGRLNQEVLDNLRHQHLRTPYK